MDEFAQENPVVPGEVVAEPVAPEPQPEPQDQPAPEEPPVYVYAIAMMPDGEVKLITSLPFISQRQALMSDVAMTAAYVASAIKDGKL